MVLSSFRDRAHGWAYWVGDQYQSRYHCQEGAPSESGRACKSEGVSGQAGGLSCSETS